MEVKSALTIIICVCVSSIVGDISRQGHVLDEGSCVNGECLTEDDETIVKHQKDKYFKDKLIEIFKEKFGETREPTDEEIKAIMLEIMDTALNNKETQGSDSEEMEGIEEGIEIIDSNETVEEEGISESDKDTGQTTGDFEFPKLVRVDPGQVGDEVEVELDEGKFYTRITKSVRPPVFVIPDFLSAEECDHIMDSAKRNGLNTSNLFGAEILKELEERNASDISRISDQTWLRKADVGATFWNTLNNRLARLTDLDIGIIERAEPIQVVSYVPGGHYHAHIDSVTANPLPCCFQTRCGEREETAAWSQCCRLCRYITVLYYLDDVEEGGETAFPLADMPDDLFREKMTNTKDQKWYNLSLYCYNSTLVVKPKRGTAVFWYTHFIDEKTGYLGAADDRSHHGGCDLLKGTKWIANNWISSPTYENRFKQSVFYTP